MEGSGCGVIESNVMSWYLPEETVETNKKLQSE